MNASNKISRLIIGVMDFSKTKSVENMIKERDKGNIDLTNEQIEYISNMSVGCHDSNASFAQLNNDTILFIKYL